MDSLRDRETRPARGCWPLEDRAALADLRLARQVAADAGLGGWCLAAGWLRNRVWDRLVGFHTFAAAEDIDLVYHDPADTRPERDWALDERLAALAPGRRWEVRNQARMHRRHGDGPYRDTADALAHWLETATGVGVRLEADGQLSLVAPWGLGDLYALTLRPTPSGRQRLESYLARVMAKGWRRRWPGLRVLER